MSTRAGIKWNDDPKRDFSLPSYHLFHDCYAETIEQRGAKVPVVWLELEEVQFACDSQGTVTVAIPKEWAVKLGLLEDAK
jgi:hypothetical protein